MRTIMRAGLLAPSTLALAIACSGRMFADAAPGATLGEKIEANRARQEELLTKNEELYAIADAEGRELTKEENEEFTGNQLEFDRLERDCARRIDLQARSDALTAPQPRKVAASATGDEVDEEERGDGFRPAAGSGARDLGPLAARSKTHGFKSMGQFAKAVQLAKAGSVDQRLVAAAAGTVSTEGVGSDGGYAVPPEYRDAILERVFAEDSLLGRTNPIPIASNSMTMPSDMTTPWDSSGGIQAYWTGEAAAITQSKVKLEPVEVKLQKIAALVLVSDELLEDAGALGAYIERKAPEKIDFKISYALAWGNGAGMPLGFMNSPALVTQAAEGSQTTDTINAQNVVKMQARMPVSSRKNSVWFCHPDAEPQFPLMTIGNQPVYLPPGGLSGNQYGILLGRPVIPHEICETVGDLGDLMYVDMASYLAVKKSTGLKTATSIHLYFDQSITAFKFELRIGGQPWWSAPITPRDGSNTRSPFVTLASR